MSDDIEMDPDVAAVAGLAPTPPAELEGEHQERADPREAAQVSALITAQVVETVVTRVWPVLTFTDAERSTFVERLAPVFQKYGGGLPPWLAAWREELELAAFLGLTGFECWQRIEAARESVDDGEASGSEPA